jgi:stage II sporulation protein M
MKIVKKKKLNLKEEYSSCFKYLKDSKKFIFISIGIFCFFALIGFFIPTPALIYDMIINFIKEITEKTKNMSNAELIQFITLNNIKSTFFSIFFGLVFGILPIIGAISNGYILGFVALMSVEQQGILSLLSLIPHGIFEFPAIFISLGIGLKLGMLLFNKNYSKNLKPELIKALRVFLLIILPLLIIAGIIEGSLINIS